MKFLQVINLARDKLSRKQLEYQGHPFSFFKVIKEDKTVKIYTCYPPDIVKWAWGTLRIFHSICMTQMKALLTLFPWADEKESENLFISR